MRKLKRDYELFLLDNVVIIALKDLGDYNHLEYLGVSPTSQGRGYGKKVLDHFSKITLECKRELIPFYEKMGFTVLAKNKRYYFLFKGMSRQEAKKQLQLFLFIRLFLNISSSDMVKSISELIMLLVLQTYYIFWFRDITT